MRNWFLLEDVTEFTKNETCIIGDMENRKLFEKGETDQALFNFWIYSISSLNVMLYFIIFINS